MPDLGVRGQFAHLAPGIGEEMQRPPRRDRWDRAGAASPPPHCADWRTGAFPPPPGARSERRNRRGSYRPRRAPRRTSGGAPCNGAGISAIVRTLAVTSSPSKPSPRVAACVSAPFSKRREQDRPSILGSAVMASGASAARPRKRRTRAPNSSTSSSLKTFAEREHRNDVADFGEFFRRRRADLPSEQFGRR